MNFHQLRIENFGSIGAADVPLDGQGLVLIDGENLDAGGSNGAGKTTLIPDAISWCLFGVTTKGLKADEVVRQPDGHSGTLVQVDFALGEQEVTVVRCRKHAELGNRITILIDGVDRTPANAKLAEEMLGKLIGTTPDVWRYAVILGQGLAFRFSQLPDSERERLLEQVVSLQVYDRGRQAALARSRELEASLARAAGYEVALREQIEADRQNLSAAVLRLKAENAEWEVRSARLQQEVAGLATSIEAAAAAVVTAQRELTTFDERSGTVVQEARSCELQMARVAPEITQRRAVVQRLEREATALASAASCTACGQPLPEGQRAAARARTADQLETERGLLASLEAQYSAEDARLQQLTSAATRVKEQRGSYVGVVAQAVAGHSGLRVRHAALTASLQEGGKSFPSAALVTALQHGIQTKEGQLEVFAKDAAGQKETLALSQFWIDGFAAIRRQRIAETVDLLNRQLKYYLDALSGGSLGASIKVSEKATAAGTATKFDLEIRTPGGSYRSASGGEKDRVDVAIAFALHDLVMASSGFFVNILVADELCPGVDAQGIEFVVTALRAKLDRLGSVFVITHHPAWARLADSVWTVRKQGGVSSLLRKGAAPE